MSTSVWRKGGRKKPFSLFLTRGLSKAREGGFFDRKRSKGRGERFKRDRDVKCHVQDSTILIFPALQFYFAFVKPGTFTEGEIIRRKKHQCTRWINDDPPANRFSRKPHSCMMTPLSSLSLPSFLHLESQKVKQRFCCCCRCAHCTD